MNFLKEIFKFIAAKKILVNSNFIISFNFWWFICNYPRNFCSSIYLHYILIMTYILGISAFYHDSAACLVEDGKIISAAQGKIYSKKT